MADGETLQTLDGMDIEPFQQLPVADGDGDATTTGVSAEDPDVKPHRIANKTDVNNKEFVNEFEWVLWTGGSWVREPDTKFEEYKGDSLVKHALKLPSKNLSCEVLKNHVRAVVGLSIDEELKLTYALHCPERIILVDIVRDEDFKYFLEAVDTLPKPVTLYHVNLSGCTKGSQYQEADAGEEIHIQVPFEKVGVIIGKGGETWEKVETQSGAIIQLIPNSNGRSKEITIGFIGDKRRIELAKEMIKEAMNQEELYEVEILLFSGGGWDWDVEPIEYKGENIQKHVLRLPSNFTWAVLESRVRTELGLCLSMEDSLKLSFPVSLHPSKPVKILPIDLISDLEFVSFFRAALGEPKPMKLYC